MAGALPGFPTPEEAGITAEAVRWWGWEPISTGDGEVRVDRRDLDPLADLDGEAEEWPEDGP